MLDRQIIRYYGMQTLGLILRSLVFAALVYLGVYVLCDIVLTFTSSYTSYYALSLMQLAFLLQVWYQILVETSIVQLWEFSDRNDNLRLYARGFVLAVLISFSFNALAYYPLELIALFVYFFLSSLLVDRLHSLSAQTRNHEQPSRIIGLKELHQGLESGNMLPHDYLVCSILLVLLPAATIFALELTNQLFNLGINWEYGSILVPCILLALIPVLIYAAIFEGNEFRRERALFRAIFAYALLIVAFIGLRHFSLGPLLFFSLSFFGVVGLSLFLLLRRSLAYAKQDFLDPREPILKDAFWFGSFLVLLGLTAGFYYYISNLSPMEWNIRYWIGLADLISVMNLDAALAFNQFGFAFAIVGFLLPVYLSIGFFYLSYDGTTTKNRMVAIIVGFIFCYLAAESSSNGITNTFVTGLVLTVSLAPLIVVLLSESKERCYAEVFAVAAITSAAVEIVSASLGTLRTGFGVNQYGIGIVFGGYAFLSILWINSLMALSITALIRIWVSVNLTDDEVFEKILPWNIVHTLTKWYMSTSKRKKTLIPVIVLLGIILIALRPSVPSLYSVDDLSADVGSYQPTAMTMIDGDVYVASPSSIRVLSLQGGLRSYYYASFYAMGSIIDMEIRLDETAFEGSIREFYVATDNGLASLNVTHPWSDPAFVLNNTALENDTFIDIELDSSGSQIYAVALNSTLWNISTSDYSFSRIHLDGLSSTAAINRIELRSKILCVATTSGFCVYDIEKHQFLLPTEGPALDRNINDIDTDGTSVYLATNEGFMIYTLRNDTVVPDLTINVPRIPSPLVDRVEYEHYLGGILLATHGGICRYHLSSKTVEDYLETASLASSGVDEMLSIQDDPNLRVFILTDSGFYLFSINYEVLRYQMYPLLQTVSENAVSITVAVVTSVIAAVSLWLLKGREESNSKGDKSQEA